MGDYRYFPEQPAPVRGTDAYGRPRQPERRAEAAPARGYVPPPHMAPVAYGADPYGADRYAQDNAYGDQIGDDTPYDPYDPYAPPVAHAPYGTPPLSRGPVYAPHGYGQPAASPVPPVAERPHSYGFAAQPAAPAWIKPQTAQPRAAAPATPPLRPAALLHGLGAVMSLGLVVLAGAWTWGMMQRDVSGVPVVRALEGPMRVAPDSPGGQQAAFQGLAVNALAGAGATTENDVIVLAPQPLGLGQVAPAAPTESAAIEVAYDAGPVAPLLGFNNPNRLAVKASPRPRGRENGGAQFAAAAPAPFAAPVTAPPALSTSNDPQAADVLAASIAQSVAQDLAGPRGIDVDPASIGPGTRLVQLGAYDNPDEARRAWEALSRRFSPLLNDRGRVIEAAHSGGSVFYRLRAHGFTDERDARRFCAALVAEQIDCIPVLVR